MRIYSQDYSILKKEIQKLKNEINHCNRIDKLSYIYRLIESLEFFYNFLTDNDYQAFNKKTRISELVNKYYYISRVKVFNNNINLRNTHEKLAIDLLSPDNKDIIIEPFEDNVADNIKISQSVSYDIEKDFLKKYNRSFLEIYNKVIKSNSIFRMPYDQVPHGYSLSDSVNNKHYIFIDEDENSDLESMITRQHELGHIVDEKYYPMKNQYQYSLKSSLLEVIAYMHQKDFMEFLITEGICVDSVKKHLSKYYRDMYDEVDILCILYTLPDEILYMDKYKNMGKYELMKNVLENTVFEVDVDDFQEPYNMDLNMSLRYGYGPLLATYFSYLKKHNKDKYKDSFNKFLELRSDYLKPDFFEKIGTAINEVTDIVDEEIMSSDVKIKILK